MRQLLLSFKTNIRRIVKVYLIWAGILLLLALIGFFTSEEGNFLKDTLILIIMLLILPLFFLVPYYITYFYTENYFKEKKVKKPFEVWKLWILLLVPLLIIPGIDKQYEILGTIITVIVLITLPIVIALTDVNRRVFSQHFKNEKKEKEKIRIQIKETKEEEKKRAQKMEEAEEFLAKNGIQNNYDGTFSIIIDERMQTFSDKGVYDELVDKLIKSNFDMKYVISFRENAVVAHEKHRIREREKRFELKKRAEREYYGKEKTKRISLSDEDKENILSHFDHQCTICGAKEGLHIHHKDKNPSNNQMSNLLALCGVCHKKVHMKVR